MKIILLLMIPIVGVSVLILLAALMLLILGVVAFAASAAVVLIGVGLLAYGAVQPGIDQAIPPVVFGFLLIAAGMFCLRSLTGRRRNSRQPKLKSRSPSFLAKERKAATATRHCADEPARPLRSSYRDTAATAPVERAERDRDFVNDLARLEKSSVWDRVRMLPNRLREKRLDRAWLTLGRYLDAAEVARIRQACDRFLKAYGAMPLNMATIELAAQINGDVPEMIVHYLSMAPLVDAEERCAALTKMADRLRILADQSERFCRAEAVRRAAAFDEAINRPYRADAPTIDLGI